MTAGTLLLIAAAGAPDGHPRVLFTAEDLPAIRARLETAWGRRALEALRWQIEHPGKTFLQEAESGRQPPPGQAAHYACYAAFIHQVAGDADAGARASRYLRYWLQRSGPAPAQPIAHGPARWLAPLALAYDWSYAVLPAELRDGLRRHLACRTQADVSRREWRKPWYHLGPSVCGRGCDWGAITASDVLLAALAIEGEPGYDPAILPAAVELMTFVLHWGFTAEGTMFNGNLYVGCDFSGTGWALAALKRRGANLLRHPNLWQMPTWLAHEVVPYGYQYDNRNQSAGHTSADPLTVALAAEGAPAALWVQEQGMGEGRRLAYDPAGLIALLAYGVVPEAPAPRPADLPLSWYASAEGIGYSRSGWGARDALFVLAISPPGQHHTHQDQGQFTLYGHGLTLAADSGVSFFDTREHNLLLIDGKGQPYGQGMTDGVVAARLESGLADLTSLDLTPSYAWALDGDTSAGPQSPDGALTWGRGIPFIRKPHLPLRSVTRDALFVRGPCGPYVVLLDQADVGDGRPHQYDWRLHTPLALKCQGAQATAADLYGGRYLIAPGDTWARFEGAIAQRGTYHLWCLARPRPDLKSFNWHSMGRVNGQWSEPFYLQSHGLGWRWYRVRSRQKDLDHGFSLNPGPVTVEISFHTGAWLAQVLLAADARYVPADTPLKPPAGAVLWRAEQAAAKDRWPLADQPCPRAGLRIFSGDLGPAAVTQETHPKTGLQVLNRRMTAAAGRFLTVLHPFAEGAAAYEFSAFDAVKSRLEVTGGGVSDVWAFARRGQPTEGPLQTNALAAFVRRQADRLVGYAVLKGTSVDLAGLGPILHATAPVQALHDGRTLQIDAPGGTTVTALALEAREVIVNRAVGPAQRDGPRLVVTVPKRPDAWQVTVSPDGAEVTITGDGPRPLKVLAPRAIRCVLNGLSVYFSRGHDGHIYPKVDTTVPTHGPDPPDTPRPEKYKDVP